jgi:hypothetical protein
MHTYMQLLARHTYEGRKVTLERIQKQRRYDDGGESKKRR